MIDDFAQSDSEVEKIVDLIYSIIKVINADNEVTMHLSDMTVTLMMTVQRSLRS